MDELLEKYFPHEDWCCAKGCPGYGHCPDWRDCSNVCRCVRERARLMLDDVRRQLLQYDDYSARRVAIDVLAFDEH